VDWIKQHGGLALSALVALLVALGVTWATPGQRLSAVEQGVEDVAVGVATVTLRHDSLLGAFGEHVEQGVRRDSAIIARMDKILIGECLDRSERELNLMSIPCDSLLTSRRGR
jgi:hypothetical protein